MSASRKKRKQGHQNSEILARIVMSESPKLICFPAHDLMLPSVLQVDQWTPQEGLVGGWIIQFRKKPNRFGQLLDYCSRYDELRINDTHWYHYATHGRYFKWPLDMVISPNVHNIPEVFRILILQMQTARDVMLSHGVVQAVVESVIFPYIWHELDIRLTQWISRFLTERQ